MRPGGGGKDEAPDKVMGPLFPRLHVNDTVKGGPRAPPRNKMALYEQFSVPSHRFTTTASAPPWQPHRPTATSAVPSTSASQVGGTDRPFFPSFCVPSTEPVRSSDHKNTNSNGRAGKTATARAESGRKSTQLKTKDTNGAGSIAGCTSQLRQNNIQNSLGKKLTNDDDFTVPSVLYSGMPPHSTQESVRIQEKASPCPATSPYKNGSTMSKSSAKCSNTDRRHLEGMIVSDAKSRESPGIRNKEPVKMMTDLEISQRTSSFQTSKKKLGTPEANVSLCRDRSSNFICAKKQHSDIEACQAKSRKENSVELQKSPSKNGTPPSSKLCTGTEHNGSSNLLKHGLREAGEKRKRSHHEVEQNDDLSNSSVESLPELEVSPDDVVSAIGPKHFWKARRAIVNQQRVFAVQVFELHRLIKVQKLIAASPHLLIEGDPCLGKALVASKTKLAGGNMEKQLPSSKSKDDVQPTLQQQEYSKDNAGANQPSPSEDVAAVQHVVQGTTNGAVSSNPPAMPTGSENKQGSWCIPPPPNQWLVPVMSLSEGLVYKPYTGPCPPAGSFLAPFYAGCTPVSLPSTAGDFMNSAYGIPMPHQPQHMGAPGPPSMPPMYFPPFSMAVMNPAASASAVEQVSHVAAWPNRHREQHSRSSCNMSHLRSEALSAGVWRFHASRDSELQGSSASSPFDRQQGEGRGPEPLPAEPSGGNGPLCGSRDNTGGVIRVVPHTARTASESAARIFQSIRLERQQSDL